MKEIVYTIDNESGTIQWAAAEYFGELEDKTFKLDQMEAVQIEKLENLSVTAKILLSALAGAIIQHLIDKGVTPEQIFNKGSFRVKK